MPSKKILMSVGVSLEEVAEAISELGYQDIVKLFVKIDDRVEDCEFTRMVAKKFNEIVSESCDFDEEE